MATKTISSCSSCGYPLTANYEGERVNCPMCKTVNVAVAQGVRIPTWLFASSIGLAVGIFFGPALLASTEAGAKYLERQVRERTR